MATSGITLGRPIFERSDRLEMYSIYSRALVSNLSVISQFALGFYIVICLLIEGYPNPFRTPQVCLRRPSPRILDTFETNGGSLRLLDRPNLVL